MMFSSSRFVLTVGNHDENKKSIPWYTYLENHPINTYFRINQLDLNEYPWNRFFIVYLL